jgi:1,4-dihydroxy-2-naphthoate octaprenyltransferase
MRTLWAIIQLGRPHFLLGGFLLYGLGAILARYAGVALDGSVYLWGQIAVTATQLMTHYANDYFDLAADQANLTPTAWSGGSRVLVQGRLPRRAALIAALVLAAVALVANLVLSLGMQLGVFSFGLLVLAQALAWLYSAPPLRLHSTGLGELTATLVVALLTSLTGYALQAGQIDGFPFITVLPLLCFQFNMLLAVEFPDASADREAGKRNLVVRLGPALAARLYLTLLLLAFALLPLLWMAGLPRLVIGALAALSPLGLWQAWRTLRGDWRDPARWGLFAFGSIALLVAASLAELLSYTLAV